MEPTSNQSMLSPDSELLPYVNACAMLKRSTVDPKSIMQKRKQTGKKVLRSDSLSFVYPYRLGPEIYSANRKLDMGVKTC